MRKGRWFQCVTVGLWCFLAFTCLARSLPADDVKEAGNNVYRVFIQADPASGKLGVFSAGTGPLHTEPGNNILHGAFFPPASPRTTYLTIRSWTTGSDYVTRSGNPSSGFAVFNISDYGKVDPFGNGFRTTWTLPGPPETPDKFTIVQDLYVEGITQMDSRIRVTTCVKNDGKDPSLVSVRYEWDIMVDGNDASVFRTRVPDGAWQDSFESFADPQFKAFEITDLVPPNNLFSIFGTVAGTFGLTPPPTAPDLLYYCSWSDAYNNAWDFSVSGGQADSSVVYFFGSTEDKASNIPPGKEICFTAYLATTIFPPPPPESVPALGALGACIMAGLLGVFLVLRRRGV